MHDMFTCGLRKLELGDACKKRLLSNSFQYCKIMIIQYEPINVISLECASLNDSLNFYSILIALSLNSKKILSKKYCKYQTPITSTKIKQNQSVEMISR